MVVKQWKLTVMLRGFYYNVYWCLGAQIEVEIISFLLEQSKFVLGFYFSKHCTLYSGFPLMTLEMMLHFFKKTF